MKKIIYSLVAMLFMGGIITSCIENPEPQGVFDMREAHARYLDALASWTKANEAVAAAEAAFKNAQAAVKQAAAREKTAQAVAKEIANAIAQAQADQQIANILDGMEKDRLDNEKALIASKIALAQAQKNLEDALNAIEIERLGLSDEEVDALTTIHDIYFYWMTELYSYLDSYKDLDNDLRDWLLEAYKDEALDEAEMEYLLQKYNKQIELKENELKYKEQEVAFWDELLDEMILDEDAYLAKAAEFDQMAKDMAPEFAKLLEDSVLFAKTYGFARDEAMREADSTYINAIKEPQATYDAAIADLKAKNPNWKNQVNEPGKAWTAKGGKYAFNKKYALPEHEGMAPNLIKAYVEQLGFNGFAGEISFVGEDTLKIKIDEVKDSAAFAAIVDTVWNGNQETEKLLKKKTGLWSVYEDFGRAYLFDLDAEGLKDDADFIRAYADKKRAEYDSILKILKSAKEGQGKALVKAWADKVAGAGASIDKLAEAVDALQNKTGDPEKDVYKYTDNSTKATNKIGAKGPKVLVAKTELPRKVTVSTSDPTDFTLEDVTSEYFAGGAKPTRNITIAPTPADSVAVFEAVVNYFKAIAAVDESKVPYLRFMASKDGGMTYGVDSVRADLMVFDGIKMKGTNGHIKAAGINMAAQYDNKGMVSKDDAPVVAQYDDAFGNVMNLFNHFVHKDDVLTSLYTTENKAQYAENSGVADYVAYVAAFKAEQDAKGATLDGFHKAFSTYTAKQFADYSSKTDEGKAVANWMAACETYFGVEGFGGFGEKVFFDFDTFTDPTWVVIFNGAPVRTPTYDKKGNKDGVTVANGTVATPSSYQYNFVKKAITDNMTAAGIDGTYTIAAYVPGDMEAKSLVFNLLSAEYLYQLATNTSSLNEIWEALGEVLEQAKADMDAVDGNAKATKAKNQALADKFQEAYAAYTKATKAAKDARDKAKKDAQDAYNEAYEEIMVPIMHEYSDLKAEYDFYKGLAEALREAYAGIWAGGKADEAALRAALEAKYTAAVDQCASLAKAIETLKQKIAQLEADFETFANDPLAGVKYDAYGDVIPYAEDDWKAGEIYNTEMLAALAEEIEFINAILGGLESDYLADIEFWYEYWANAYAAALEWVANK